MNQTSMAKAKALITQLEDRATLLTKFKALSSELDNYRERIENEAARKSDTMKVLSQAHAENAEIQLWRSRYETEGMGRIDKLECGRSKLQSRIV